MKINQLRILVYDLHKKAREEGYANYKMNLIKTQESFDERDNLRLDAINKNKIIVEELEKINNLLEDLDDFLAHEEDVAHGEGAKGITNLRKRINEFLNYHLPPIKHQTNE